MHEHSFQKEWRHQYFNPFQPGVVKTWREILEENSTNCFKYIWRIVKRKIGNILEWNIPEYDASFSSSFSYKSNHL